MIPYGRQSINQADVDSVIEALNSKFLTQGPAVPIFEKAVADYCNVAYSVAVNSATSALHLACLALGLGKNDLVWTTPITFVATANCALYCGALVDFIDIDPYTYNLSIERLTEKLKKAKHDGCLPKIVIPVHLCGQPCNMVEIYTLSKQYGFKIIEDASHAIGGRYRDKPIGNCKYSDITVFSFHPVKIITTGEGGMALTNSAKLATHMIRLRSHGITRDEKEMTHSPDGPWYYQQVELGFNYRMTDIQAALGISQVSRLNDFVSSRYRLSKRYDELLSDLPVTIPWQHPDSYSSLHLYIIRLNLAEFQKTHRLVFDELRAAGIGVNLHYIPVYTQPYYEKMGFKKGYCIEAERYYAEAISLPMFPDLTNAEQEKVISTLSEILK